jgi:hypothetical protein
MPTVKTAYLIHYICYMTSVYASPINSASTSDDNLHLYTYYKMLPVSLLTESDRLVSVSVRLIKKLAHR